MIYSELKEGLLLAKQEGDKAAVSDLIGAIDSIDKAVFADKKKAGEGEFIIQDAVAVAVLKNQIKNTMLSYDKALSLVGVTEQTDALRATADLLKHYLPPAVEGDDLRLIIQGLGAKNMGQAMGMLKAQSADQGFSYDGGEASSIAKGIFV